MQIHSFKSSFVNVQNDSADDFPIDNTEGINRSSQTLSVRIITGDTVRRSNFIMILKAVLLAICIANSEAVFGWLFQTSTCKDCKALQEEAWSYCGNNGPEYWGGTCAQARNPNARQSPINIDLNNVRMDANLAGLAMENYNIPVSSAIMVNNGHTIQVTPNDGVDRTMNVNGETYRLLQFHFHWGGSNSRGSEHSINGLYFPLELHLVHSSADGKLAVAGVLYKLGMSNPELQTLTNQFGEVKYKDTETQLRSRLNLSNMVPLFQGYFRYNGSLTTPGCTEGVTWSLFQQYLHVSMRQMKEFRKMYATTKKETVYGCELVDNYRPVQPLNERPVYSSGPMM